VDRDTVLDETNLEKFLELAHRLDVTDDRIRTIDAKQSNIRATLEGLEPWRAMDVPWIIQKRRPVSSLSA
jgi:hypothetical protein